MTHKASRSRKPISRFAEWLMAIGEVERNTIATEPKLREEIGFQVIALCLCPLTLGYAIYKVAISLFGYPPLTASVGAAIVGYCLFAIDRHYLIQARGDASDHVRRAVYKVRAVSIAIISMSFMLTSTHTFRDEIDQVLAESIGLRRAELEQLPRYQPERDSARDAVTRAGDAIRRADELRTQVTALQIRQAAAREEYTNQCQGNTTGNKTRKRGCGPEAGGAKQAAERLDLEIAAANQELGRLSPVVEGFHAARQQLEAVEQRIDEDAARSVSGSTHRADALIEMLVNSWTARIVMLFWFLIGLVPDMLMFAAQGRMFNHELFEPMREAQNEAVRAEIARQRRELRQQQQDSLEPIEVRLDTVSRPIPEVHDATAHIRRTKDKTEELA